MEEYKLIVRTNSYAGNFERELCAFMIGIIGDCEVGVEFVEENITKRFENKVIQKQDSNGTYRPVSLERGNPNNIVIFFEDKLSDEDMIFLTARAIKFQNEKPYEYLDKNFEFLRLDQFKITIKTEKIRL